MLYEFTFPSFNERDQVQAWYYVPAAEPTGIVQLVHGYGEHSRRYLHMIVKFMDAGYIVVADDHVGHGRTAVLNDTWGDWGDKGFETMVEDEYSLMKLAKEQFPDLPYFFFGHSMGSVITRQFMARYGGELDGVTLCGTCGTFDSAEAARILEEDLAAGKANETDPAAAEALMGWMNERIEDVKIGNEWICHDEFVQKDHAQDPLNAFVRPITNKSLLYFIRMMDDVQGEEWAKKVPVELPIYSIGGDQDPFGGYASGLYEVSNNLIKTGHDVFTEIYNGLRHEVHNYADANDDVEEGIIDFMDNIALGE
ncbi:MAG: lysophospholipase [Clostridia bacterium]|nr:lysophospholipase [Clostridia bacterium]